MDKAQRKKFIRLVYAKTLRYFAIALVLSAIIASFYGDRLHFVFALCALGGIFLAWLVYLPACHRHAPSRLENQARKEKSALYPAKREAEDAQTGLCHG